MAETYESHEIVIVGGGICGLATALALQRKGIKSIVLEKSKTLRAKGVAITMQPNGWRVLDHLGIGSILRQSAIPITWDEVRCLRRIDFVKALADNLSPNTVWSGCGVVFIRVSDYMSRSILQLEDGRVVVAKVVIGCDGINSVVADVLELNPVKLLSITATRGFTPYENGHEFGGNFFQYKTYHGHFGQLSVTDKLVYWYFTRKVTVRDSMISEDQQLMKQLVLESVKGFPQYAIDMIKNCVESSLHHSRLRYRQPLDILTTKFRKGLVTVAGDAYHATGPFLAQGGAISLEDAIVLANCLASKLGCGLSSLQAQKPIEEALDNYLEQRRKRVFWMCLHSFLLGNTIGTSSKLVEVVSILLLSILYRDRFAHTRFDCGPL